MYLSYLLSKTNPLFKGMFWGRDGRRFVLQAKERHDRVYSTAAGLERCTIGNMTESTTQQ
jgi:hypothetical protein